MTHRTGALFHPARDDDRSGGVQFSGHAVIEFLGWKMLTDWKEGCLSNFRHRRLNSSAVKNSKAFCNSVTVLQQVLQALALCLSKYILMYVDLLLFAIVAKKGRNLTR